MKKNLLVLAFALCTVIASAQTHPKQHVYYDTVKTVHEQIDYAPDTIPVYFKELVLPKDSTFRPFEVWNKGFVVWQTYKKLPNSSFSAGSWSGSMQEYYKDEYSASQLMPGQFLYADKKSVKNKVIFSIKR